MVRGDKACVQLSTKFGVEILLRYEWGFVDLFLCRPNV
jgi:hypothetical protein